jgi:hypothetical protein
VEDRRGTAVAAERAGLLGGHGFVDTGGNFVIIDIPGSVSTGVTGINDRGQIVGIWEGSDGSSHGFIGTPVPEPGSLPLLASGLIGLLFMARRKRAELRET